MDSEPSASAARRFRGKEDREGGEKKEREVIEEERWREPISAEDERS